MNPDLLIQLFGINLHTIRRNTEGLTDAESRSIAAPGANSLTWILGHLLKSRNAVMAMLGHAPVWTDPAAALFDRGGAGQVPDGTGPDLATLLQQFEAAQVALAAALRDVPAAALALPPAAAGFESLPGETLGAKVGFLHFHEAYHCGQIGLLRKLLGKPGAIR